MDGLQVDKAEHGCERESNRHTTGSHLGQAVYIDVEIIMQKLEFSKSPVLRCTESSTLNQEEIKF
jgi:hypothetical protein